MVRTPQPLRLAAVLVGAGAEPSQLDGTCLEVRGLDRTRIGDLAFRNEIPLHELSVRSMADDPVVAVLEACRRPASVVPVQAPATARVPEHARAKVSMPFLGGRATEAEAEEEPGARSPAESALLSVMEVPRSATEAASGPSEPREPAGNVRVRDTATSATTTTTRAETPAAAAEGLAAEQEGAR